MTKLATMNIWGYMQLKYDENDPRFQEALADYKAVIDKDGDIESMLCHVVFHLTKFGVDNLVEGVGYVGYGGRSPEDNYCGIMIIGDDYDDFNYRVDDINDFDKVKRML